MLRVKRIVCLLNFIFILNTYSNISTITPFHVLATDVVKDKNIETELNDDNKVQSTENLIAIQGNKYSDPRIIDLLLSNVNKDLEFKKEQEEKKIETEPKEFILTFYTSLNSENSSAGAVTCENKPLVSGGVANNVLPLNTKIYLEGYGQVVVNDRGSNKYFNVDNRLDVYIPRESGESDKQYFRRVNNYGIQRVQGYILK
jgi:3D (Asp-Asp-Asp) domain-containing protein